MTTNQYQIGTGMTATQFADYAKKAKSMSDDALEYSIEDLKDVIEVQEKAVREGHAMPKLAFYWDELHTYCDERVRRKGGVPFPRKQSLAHAGR